MVHNYMETLVSTALKNELAENPEKYTDVCQSPRCIAFIEAVALNHLKPFYVTGVAGTAFGEFKSKEYQHMSDVMVAIGKGIEELKRAPI